MLNNYKLKCSKEKVGEGYPSDCRAYIDSPDFAVLVDLSPATPQRGWVWFFLSERIPLSAAGEEREGRAKQDRSEGLLGGE